jgi:hypothetical protein
LSNANSAAALESQLESNASSTLSQPLNLGPSALQNQMNQENEATLDPQWAANNANNQQSLYDRGLTPGSAGYTSGMENESTLENQAYDQMYVSDEGAAQNTIEQQYMAPLNALTALQSDSQVSQPGVGQTAATSSTGVNPTNVAGIDEQTYAEQVAQSNAAMGGLFGLGGSLLTAGTAGSSNGVNTSILGGLFGTGAATGVVL